MSEIKREDEIPRRARVDLWCQAEKAIQAAVDAVEAMSADVRLTDAVNQLWEARQSVADYVDGVPRRVPAVLQERDTLARRVVELEKAVRWALGEEGKFSEEPPPFKGTIRRRFWWRTELRQRAFPPVRD